MSADQNRGKAVGDAHTVDNQPEFTRNVLNNSPVESNPVPENLAMQICFYKQHTVHYIYGLTP